MQAPRQTRHYPLDGSNSQPQINVFRKRNGWRAEIVEGDISLLQQFVIVIIARRSKTSSYNRDLANIRPPPQTHGTGGSGDCM